MRMVRFDLLFLLCLTPHLSLLSAQDAISERSDILRNPLDFSRSPRLPVVDVPGETGNSRFHSAGDFVSADRPESKWIMGIGNADERAEYLCACAGCTSCVSCRHDVTVY